MGLLNRVHMLGVVVVFGVVAVVHGVAAQTMDPRFDTDGNLLRPEGYREWIYVGTPVTPNDMNSGKAAFPEFHTPTVGHITRRPAPSAMALFWSRNS